MSSNQIQWGPVRSVGTPTGVMTSEDLMSPIHGRVLPVTRICFVGGSAHYLFDAPGGRFATLSEAIAAAALAEVEWERQDRGE